MLLTYSRGTNPILYCLLKYKKGHEFILDLEEIHLFAETEALDLSITFQIMRFQKKRRYFCQEDFLTCTTSCAHEKYKQKNNVRL